jgi:putative nucleotidyltransferase-like protein
VACLRHEALSLQGLRIRSDDVRRLHVLAAPHGINPLIYGRLGEVRAAGVELSPDDERPFRLAYHHSRLRAYANRHETAEALRALIDAGIPVVALKGAFLAEHVYEDEALRPMLDLDLLVPAECAQDAAARLVDIGYDWDASSIAVGPKAFDYRSHHHMRRLVRDERLPVELHTALTRSDAPWQVDPHSLWRGVEPARVAGVDVLALAPEHLLLHLVVHAATHAFVVPLLALEDIARVGERLVVTKRWSRFVEAAHNASAGGLAYGTLALARTLLAAGIPPAALDALSHTADDEAIVPSLARTILDQFTELPTSYERSLRERRPWSRVATLARALVPSPSRIRADVGPGAGIAAMVWGYLRRPFDLVRRHRHSLRTLLSPGRYLNGRIAAERWLRP